MLHHGAKGGDSVDITEMVFLTCLKPTVVLPNPKLFL